MMLFPLIMYPESLTWMIMMTMMQDNDNTIAQLHTLSWPLGQIIQNHSPYSISSLLQSASSEQLDNQKDPF